MNTRARLTLAAALALASALVAGTALAGSPKGIAGSMNAFYDGKLFLINFAQIPNDSVLAHNGQTNNIYMSDATLPGGGMFVPVLDAIQADGFNPLWQEVDITFNAGHAPQQFTSDNDVLAAAASGVITLTATGELYRCSVVGKPQGGSGSGKQISPLSAAPAHATTWGEVKRAYR